MKNKIVVITPFYNPGKFLDNCVSSIMSQNYDNFHVIFIDDASTDDSFDKLPHNVNNVTIIKNKDRKTALENIHNAVMNFCDPESICCLIDGDDWLPKKNVLSQINDFYNANDCSFAYGQAAWTDGRRGFASAYTKEEFENLRTAPFRVSHIRTFRAGLYHSIKKIDPEFKCLKDKDGNFYKITYDVAIVLPLMELAGFDKVKFNDSILYIYNRSNPISDDRVNQAGQTDTHLEILKKASFRHDSRLVLDIVKKIETGKFNGPNSCIESRIGNIQFDFIPKPNGTGIDKEYVRIVILDPKNYNHPDLKYLDDLTTDYPFADINQERFDKIKEILKNNNCIKS